MTDLERYLDVEELVQLAQYEVARRQPAYALAFLKMAAAKQPESATVPYLRGLLHADLGMVSRAIDDFEAALRLQPALHAARLRLGELLMHEGDLAQVRAAWQPLHELTEDAALQAYMRGMLLLAEGDVRGYVEFESALRDGAGDPGLLATMHRMLDESRVDQRQHDAAEHRSLSAGAEAAVPTEQRGAGAASIASASRGLDIAALGMTPSLYTAAAIAAFGGRATGLGSS